MLDRRQLLMASAGLLGVSFLPLGKGAFALTGSQRKFLFVFARGGWDTTRVFSPMFHAPSIDMEPDATTATLNGISFVDHPDRDRVRTFFERYGARTAVLDGMLVRSVNHQVCERLVLTGDSKAGSSDWPSILGAAVRDDHALPNIVMGGPSEPGSLHRYTSIVGVSEQLSGLLDGSAIERADRLITPLGSDAERIVDDALRVRLQGRLDGATDAGQVRMLDSYVDGLDRVARLREDAELVDLSGGQFNEQMEVAVELLRYGVARSVCAAKTGFDTHSENVLQSGLMDDLFDGLITAMEALDATPGTVEATMADETIVVVLSEMGRTPYENTRAGKDHWPYTAAMVIGPGVAGGQKIGGYDEYLNGRPINLATGVVTDGGTVVTPSNLGATLLTLADVDPAEWIPDVDVLAALLA